ncbi:MAG: type II toxin-antitoxin system RelE family toxin [Candidatus Nanoarchaeia archaeon]
MYEFLIEEKLGKKLNKLYNKDISTYLALMKKIEEIISTESLEHYKNLKYPLQEYKRVHIRKSFVLVFKFDSSKNKVLFFDFEHHDEIYR